MSYSGNKPRPWQPCFFQDQKFFKESWKGPPKEHSCQIILKSIEPFWRRRFLKFYYMPYSENKPRPQRPCFLSDQNFFKESKKDPPKEHSCQIIMKSIEPFYSRRFFKFTICHIVKTSPAHGGHVFCRIKISSRNLEEVHPRNIHAKLYWNPLSHFGEEDF